jgi:3-oxoacyl-(acyl-carrier-protein) synthase
MNTIYINGLGNVSPQRTAGNASFPDEHIVYGSNRLGCIEPNYRDFISPDNLRRMGRLIKMGVASARICLADANCAMPDAIITGTGLGCLEDTEKFLTAMVTNKEEFLTPTSFIQSTHNTVSAQIALLLKCYNYNFTYVHRGWSFESALTDAMVQLMNGRAGTVLAGGMDELTNNSFRILERLGHLRRTPVNNSELFNSQSKGTIAGEGSAFFLLSRSASPSSYAILGDVCTFNLRAGKRPLLQILGAFMEKSGLKPADIDLIIGGMNGDLHTDQVFGELIGSAGNTGIAAWKHLSGEYMTSSAFGLWLASMIMKHQKIPAYAWYKKGIERPIGNILIYNHYRDLNHSFILIRKP